MMDKQVLLKYVKNLLDDDSKNNPYIYDPIEQRLLYVVYKAQLSAIQIAFTTMKPIRVFSVADHDICLKFELQPRTVPE